MSEHLESRRVSRRKLASEQATALLHLLRHVARCMVCAALEVTVDAPRFCPDVITARSPRPQLARINPQRLRQLLHGPTLRPAIAA